ncbi:MAG: hypothetical protein Ct9H300mP6_03840 [Gammaproteobacteria bacterium]|nr:MAG: hypothetical protein Ct9H300mP6_03840 [Gammaproteobacteria bacterium]
MGKHFKKGVNSGARKLSVIQEVRGSGLFIGVELKSNRITSKAKEGAFIRGVLVGQTGLKTT